MTVILEAGYPEELSQPTDREAWHEAEGRLAVGLEARSDKPEETPLATERALWLAAGGTRVSALHAAELPLSHLTDAQRSRFRDLVSARLEGTPLAYLTGRQSFMGVEMLAAEGALIPRTETALLGGMAVDIAGRIGRSAGTFVDTCTGSANIAAILALRFPTARVLAADLSEEAVGVARRNLELLGLQRRVEVRVGDLLEPFLDDPGPGGADLVTCNPPYIATARVPDMPTEISEHEPPEAFDGGPLGIGILQRLIREAPRLLRPGGWLVFEVGAGQGRAVERRLSRSGSFDTTDTVSDAGGMIRVLAARRSEGPADA